MREESELGEAPTTLVVLLSRDEELGRRLSQVLGRVDPGIEMHVVRDLPTLNQHLVGLRPDLAVLDTTPDSITGLLGAVDRQLMAETPVIIAGQSEDERELAMGAGAVAFVQKDAEHEDELADVVLRTVRARHLLTRTEETRQQYHDILEATSDGILVLVGGVFRYVNQSFAGALGKTPAELMGRASLVEFVRPDEQKRVQEELARVEVGGGLRELLEIWLTDARGREARLEIACRSSVVEGHRALVGVARDVTATYELKEEIERARKRAAQVERLRALGELAAGVAHDFNNVVSTIIGRVGRAKKLLDSGADLAEELAVIESAAQNAAAMVRRIREFSKPAGSDTWQDVDLESVVRDAAAFLTTDVPAGVHFAVDAQPTPRIQGNGAELREVVVNLLRNAFDAVGPNGHVTVSCKEEQGVAVVIVEDDGHGMPAEVQQRIFEPFFTTKAERGTGLGLSVSHGILRRHDAELHLVSEPGQGTKFRIVFKPFSAQAQNRQRAHSEEAAMHILVVDDDSTVAEMIRDLLTDEGHHVITVNRPSDVARVLGESPADLMITDLDLPGMSGWQLARLVREIQPTILVGIVTGWAVGTSEQELAARGVDFVLAKPFTVAALQDALGQARKT